jgi:hypothetical protein
MCLVAFKRGCERASSRETRKWIENILKTKKKKDSTSGNAGCQNLLQLIFLEILFVARFSLAGRSTSRYVLGVVR